MDGSTFFFYGTPTSLVVQTKKHNTMTNKLKVFAMLFCIALFGTFSSCTKDDGGYSMPSNDNEIYNLLIGKWRVQMNSVQELPFYDINLSWTGTLWFKESGELEANGVWQTIDSDGNPNSVSWSGIGSFALYKRHLDMVVPNYVMTNGSLFDYSCTIHSITESNMTMWGSGNSGIWNLAYKFQCTKIEE